MFRIQLNAGAVCVALALAALIGDVHRRGMKFVLDGVFNHMGRNSKLFQEAAANPASP